MKVAIIGATGYGGVELIRLLHQHPEVHIHSVHSSSKEGSDLTETYPHLYAEMTLKKIDPIAIAGEVDLVFLATPSGVSSELTPELMAEGVKVIDLSGDLRLRDPLLFERWYNKKPAPERTLNDSVYGLTEWMRPEIQSASLIANPGCYPTATLLGLAPLVKGGLVETDSVIIDAKSGLSGAGRSLSRNAHFSEANENFKIYKVNSHQHIPEIEQILTSWDETFSSVVFSTHLVPMTRGIMATIYAKAKREMSDEELYGLFKETYGNSPFVRVREIGEFPSTREVYGSNYCDIGLTYDRRTGRITIVSVIDNLIKGAAGQAIQNLNVMMGMDERTGLDSLLPVYP